MDTSLYIDHRPVTSDVGNGIVVRVLLTLTGHVPADRVRAPLAMSLVLDRSGSMGGERLHAARAAAARAVDRLHPDDLVSAIVFDDGVQVLAPLARRAEQPQLVQELLAVETGGSTNLSGGWLRGRQHMHAAATLLAGVAGTSRRIVLVTDGHANVGITESSMLVELTRTARHAGISTSTIGVGDNYDDDLLRAMADAGGGNAWYVERPDQAHDVLTEELGNLLSVAAQGVQVTLVLTSDVQLCAIHSDWPTAPSPDGAPAFDLGDLYAGQPKPLLLELFVPAVPAELPSAATAARAIATLRIEADVLTDAGGVEHRTLALPIADTLDRQSTLVPELERAVVLAQAARAREDAARHQRDGNGDAAAERMQHAVTMIERSPLLPAGPYAEELRAHANDLLALSERYRSHRYSEREAKYQMQRSHNMKRGRTHYDDALHRGDE
jgi:Ca-activated chloride channel family protein